MKVLIYLDGVGELRLLRITKSSSLPAVKVGWTFLGYSTLILKDENGYELPIGKTLADA